MSSVTVKVTVNVPAPANVWLAENVDPVDRDANPKRLERLARASGGHLVTPTTLTGVTEALQQIASDIRHSYSIGYTPTSPADGKFHHLRVLASSATRGELTVGAREGYLAGPAPTGTRHPRCVHYVSAPKS